MILKQFKSISLFLVNQFFTVVVLFSAFNFQAFAQDGKSPVRVPERNKNVVQLDQSLNTVYYAARGHFLSGEVVPIYHIDVPQGLMEITISENLDNLTAQHVRIIKNGRVYYRLFFLNPEEFPNAKQIYFGTQLLSHNTYKVWNPEKPDLPGIDIKFSMSDGFNSAVNVVQAVQTNDVVEALFAASPSKPAKTFLPERFGATFQGVSYSIRNEVPPGYVENPDHDILPLHAVLGVSYEQLQKPEDVFTIYKKAAQIMGISVEDWITQQYVPRLTEFIFKLTVEFGIFPAAHTQNLKIVLNIKTGAVVGFVFRDMNDVQIDPNLTMIGFHFSKSIHEVLRKIPTKMISQSLDLDFFKKPIQSPGSQLGSYFFQSLTSIGDTYSENYNFVYKKLTDQFLIYFLQMMEKKLQQKIVLSSSAIENWNLLRDSTGRGDCRILSRIILDEAFAFYTSASLSRHLPPQAPQHQNLLRKLFLKSLKASHVAFVTEGAEDRMANVDLEFFSLEDTIVAREKRNKRKIFATAYGLSESDLDQLRKVGPAVENKPKASQEPIRNSNLSCLNLFGF